MGQEERENKNTSLENIPPEALDECREIITRGGTAGVTDHVARKMLGFLQQGARELYKTSAAMREKMKVGDGSPLPELSDRYLSIVLYDVRRHEGRIAQVADFIDHENGAVDVVKLLQSVRFMSTEETLAFAKRVLELAKKNREASGTAVVQPPAKKGFWDRIVGGADQRFQPEVDPLEEVFKVLARVEVFLAYFELAAFAADAVLRTDADLQRAENSFGEYKDKAREIIEEARKSADSFKKGAVTQEELEAQRRQYESLAKDIKLMEGGIDSKKQSARIDEALKQLEDRTALNEKTVVTNLAQWRSKLQFTRVYDGRKQMDDHWQFLENLILLNLQKYHVAVTMLVHTMEALAGIVQAGLITKLSMNLLMMQDTAGAGILCLAERGQGIVEGLAKSLEYFKEMGTAARLIERTGEALPSAEEDNVVDGEFTKR